MCFIFMPAQIVASQRTIYYHILVFRLRIHVDCTCQVVIASSYPLIMKAVAPSPDCPAISSSRRLSSPLTASPRTSSPSRDCMRRAPKPSHTFLSHTLPTVARRLHPKPHSSRALRAKAFISTLLSVFLFFIYFFAFLFFCFFCFCF